MIEDINETLAGVRPIMFSPPLAKAFGVLGALLVQQVHYWTQVAPKHREGHAWTYNTSKQWADQLQVYHEETIRKAFRELEVKGVLSTGRFNKTGFDRTLWYRVNYEAVCKLVNEADGDRWELAPQKVGKPGSIIQLKQTLPSQQNIGMEQSETLGPIPKSISKMKTQKTATSADAILKAFKEKASAPLKSPEKIPTVSDLSLLWKKRLAVEGGYVKDLTLKSLGQLKLVLKALGGRDAYRALDFALTSWATFALEVKNVRGFQVVPEKPDVGFFLKHHDVAMSLMEKKQSPAPAQSIAQYVKKESTTPKTSPASVASADDIANALAELEALTKGGS